MRNVGRFMIVTGLGVAVASLAMGLFVQVPWSAASAVLFGAGVAYAGLCGARSAVVHQSASH